MLYDDNDPEGKANAETAVHTFFLPLLVIPGLWILLAMWIGRSCRSRTLTQILMYPAAFVLVNSAFALFLLIPAAFLTITNRGGPVLYSFLDISLIQPLFIPALCDFWNLVFNMGHTMATYGNLEPTTSPIAVIVVQILLLITVVRSSAEWLGNVCYR